MNIIAWKILICCCFSHMDTINASNGSEYSYDMLPQRRMKLPGKLFPHVAYISYEGEAAFCAGAIIGHRTILTAAQCITTINGAPLDVTLMDVYLGSASPMQGVKFKVCEALPHEQYYPKNADHPNYSFDLGLVLLTTKIVFSSYIRKTRIVSADLWKKRSDTLTLPSVGYIEKNGEIQETVKATALVYVNHPECNNLAKGQSKNYSNRMICVISTTGNCDSDPGAAIIWKSSIVGIAIFKHGEQCSEGLVASTYVDVSYYRHWIKNSMKMLKKRNKCRSNTCCGNGSHFYKTRSGPSIRLRSVYW